jgi:hypothetical protein
LRRRARKSERLERDHVFGHPSRVAAAGLDVPGAIPIEVAVAVVRELLIALRAGGVGGEREAGAVVVQAVDDNDDAVGLERRKIALHGIDRHVIGIGVEAIDPDIQIVIVVQDAHFGLFARRDAVVGPQLDKAGGRHRQLPGRFVQLSIQGDFLRRPNRGHHP